MLHPFPYAFRTVTSALRGHLVRAPHQAPWLVLVFAALLLQAAPALAQTLKYMRQPGSKVGVESTVVEKNCKKATDGSGTLTCDTEIVSPPGVTEAKPFYTPFGN